MITQNKNLKDLSTEREPSGRKRDKENLESKWDKGKQGKKIENNHVKKKLTASGLQGPMP